MSTPLGTYSFLPWLRNGIAGSITSADLDATVTERASVHVDLTVSGDGGAVSQPVPKDIALYGPGDIVGLDQRAIVRAEPRHLVTSVEPNYLAHIEFYDEDLPWRYTPAAPDPSRLRLRPWIALVVLSEDEFDDNAAPGRPLPAISVANPDALPPAAGVWAWAHVHVNRSLADTEAQMRSTNMGAVIPRLRSALAENPDLACSRIVCPRRLAPNTAYHAFVVPVFESGRLAGLGKDPSAAPHATFSAWADYDGKEEPSILPVYHRWYFRTGTRQDFESLVRLLEPRPADHRVGTRDMDVQRPGAGLPGILDLDLHGILKLGGALRVPRVALTVPERLEAEHYDRWAEPEPHPFQEAMADAVNLADDYLQDPAGGPDPVLTLPLYGRWHALQQRLLRRHDNTPLPNADNWVHDLNLDPRHRVAAGFGTRVVQTNQEDYMNAAWNQLGDVLEANRRIRLAQLAKAVGAQMHTRHLRSMTPARTLALTAPVQSRVLAGGTTIRHQRATTLLPPVYTSTPLRRILRVRGPVAGRITDPTRLLERAAKGDVTAAPPKRTPPAAVTVDQIADVVVRAQPDLDRLAEALRERNLTRDAVKELPEPERFRLVRPVKRETVPVEGKLGREVAQRMKVALDEWAVLSEASDRSARREPPSAVSLKGLASAVVEAIDPRVSVPKRVLHGVKLPPWLIELLGETFVPVMAYPRIDLPMYEPLEKISTDLFCPNLHLVEQNSITLLETNQAFIEAYMVGLNHEMARELLWREYPTDQRGSVFRQFWDARGVLDTEGLSADELREKLYDIPELHRWSKTSDLGEHDNREVAGATEEELVLLIRGELLKKYPTAVIYAHRAAWQLKANGAIDPRKERVLVELTAAEEADPPRSKVRTPLYEAKVDPDCYFFGFDLTAEDAKGGTGAQPTDDPGWFFVIKERPGEPRFGLDIEREAGEHLNTFNDLAWSDAAGVEEGEHLPANLFANVTLANPTAAEVEKTQQHNEDVDVNLAATSAARWAYVLYQAPVMVALHAAEMLRERR